jgi:ATP adenylyltransferase
LKKAKPKPQRKKPRSLTAADESESHLEVWPQERDYMTRPERYKYLRKLIKTDGCVFCKSAKAGVNFESLCLYQNAEAMVVLNKYPYNTGHLLILPLRHCGDLAKLTESEYRSLQGLLLEAFKIVQQAYECTGLNMGLNHGAVAGAGLPEHLHWHIVPRWHGDTNFFPLIAETKVLSESLEQSYQRLLKYFDKL